MRSLGFVFLMAAATLFSSEDALESRKTPSKLKSYGSFFTTFFTPVTTQDPTIPLDQSVIESSLVSLTPSGGVLIKEPGDYEVTFGASIAYMINPEDPNNVQLGLYIGGVFQKGTNFTIPPSSLNTMNSLSCVVSTKSPSQELVLQFRNYTSGSLFSLGSSMPGDVTAFITIRKI